MCCLKFEDEAYKKLRVGLPKLNASIIYNNERFRITSMNLLNNSARISNKENAVDLTIDELKEVLAANKKEKKISKGNK